MESLSLYIRGVGNIKSLKNNKMIPKYGRTLLTKPDAWKQQKKIVDQLESQLYCALGIGADMTLMEQRVHFLTVSSERVEELLTLMPEDDNYMIVPDCRKLSIKVAKGEEGAIIRIDSLPEPSLLQKVIGGFNAIKDAALSIFKSKDEPDEFYRNEKITYNGKGKGITYERKE